MDEDRAERVSASLEAQFDTCRKEADAIISRLKESHEGHFPLMYIDDMIKMARVNAQLAGAIARLDSVKNRNSKTQ
jgi:hypothetical protein